MRIIVKGTVIDISHGDGVNFVTLSDSTEGGLLKIMFPSEIEIKLDQRLDLDVDVKPSLGKFGLNLRYQKSNKKGE